MDSTSVPKIEASNETDKEDPVVHQATIAEESSSTEPNENSTLPLEARLQKANDLLAS